MAKDTKPTHAPAKTQSGRENQMISLAMDLAEQQLIDGTASAQVITHFLKLGTERERLERVKLENENLLLQEKARAYKSAERIEQLYLEATNAMKKYGGSDG